MEPIISVCVPTYNQERYIEKCLISIINQDIRVPYEIIIADDCSSDSTKEILLHYEKMYGEKLRLILNDNNIGPTQNALLARSYARGKYICHCDGDDFFYQEKLRIQYEYLEKNPDYIAAWHNVDLYKESGEFIKSGKSKSKKIVELNSGDLLAFGSWGANSSIMYRYDGIPYNTEKNLMYDFEFSLMLLEHSRGVLLPNKLGGYRDGSIGSLTSSLLSNKINQQRLDQTRLWSEYVEVKKEFRKFVGFFSLLTLIKSFLKREKISIKYFKGLLYLRFILIGPSLSISIFKKFLN